MSDWISVQDSTPELDNGFSQIVLGYCEDGIPVICGYIDGIWRFHDCSRVEKKVTHWMPLTKPTEVKE